MRRFTLGLVLVFAAAAALGHDHEGMAGDDCTSARFHFDDGASFTKQEVIEAGMLPSLRAEVKNAPVSLTGGNSGGYKVVVCKAAAREADLEAIRVTLSNGELKAAGPAGSRWVAVFHIYAPDGGQVALDAENGPVSVRDFDGRLTIDAANGPLSLNHVGGEINAATKNGPVSLSGGSGAVRLKAVNGPLTIRLDGAAWTGGSLEAETANGPVTLKLPRGYASGVVVETSGGPLSCNSELCSRSALSDERPWHGEPRTIELGSGTPSVRLKAGHGPVSIRDSE